MEVLKKEAVGGDIAVLLDIWLYRSNYAKDNE